MRRSLARDPSFNIEVEAAKMSESIKLDAVSALRMAESGASGHGRAHFGDQRQWQGHQTSSPGGYGKAPHGKGRGKGDQSAPYQYGKGDKSGKYSSGNNRGAQVPKGKGKM